MFQWRITEAYSSFVIKFTTFDIYIKFVHTTFHQDTNVIKVLPFILDPTTLVEGFVDTTKYSRYKSLLERSFINFEQILIALARAPILVTIKVTNLRTSKSRIIAVSCVNPNTSCRIHFGSRCINN